MWVLDRFYAHLRSMVGATDSGRGTAERRDTRVAGPIGPRLFATRAGHSIGIIQVDEPALRELLPLKKADQRSYLDWSVNSFLLSTAGAKDDTQVHTHLCYSEFGEIIDAIDGLDADVTSIEAARSRMEVLPAIKQHGYERQIGPGVWDIHSPRVPSTQEVTESLEHMLEGTKAVRSA